MGVLTPHRGGEVTRSVLSAPCCCSWGIVGNAESAARREEDEEEVWRTSDRVTMETLLEK